MGVLEPKRTYKTLCLILCIFSSPSNFIYNAGKLFRNCRDKHGDMSNLLFIYPVLNNTTATNCLLYCFLKIVISVCSVWFKKQDKNHCHGKQSMPILILHNVLPFLMHACTLSDHRAVTTYGSIQFPPRPLWFSPCPKSSPRSNC